MMLFFEGEFLPQASLPLKSLGLECGAGVFTTMRLDDGHIESLPAHITRLLSHACQHGLEPPAIKEEYFLRLIEKNNAYTGTFRVKVLVIPLHPTATSWGKSSLIIYLDPYVPPTKEEFHLSLVSLEPPPLIAKIKTLSRLERRMLFMQMTQSGFDECLTCSSTGILLEAIYANVFWHHQGSLYTPGYKLPLMVGITIVSIQQTAENLGLSFKQVTQTLDDIPSNAQLFISNSLIRFRPVVCVGTRTFSRDRALEEKLWNGLANKDK